MYLINYFQCIKRQREFSDDETNRLIELIRDNKLELSLKLAVSILLEYFKESKKYFLNLTLEEQNEFKKYPIMKLWTEFKE